MKASAPILLLEDDAVDVMAIKRAMQTLNMTNPLQVASNGEEGLATLKHGMLGAPGLILLDLNMPCMNGIEFLRVVKQDDHFRRVPVVVLTTSNEEDDRLQSYNLGAAGYVIKPVDYSRFVEVMRAIVQYWNNCETPP